MSEFHDKHTVSRLLGATPGFVGYEEWVFCHSIHLADIFQGRAIDGSCQTETICRRCIWRDRKGSSRRCLANDFLLTPHPRMSPIYCYKSSMKVHCKFGTKWAASDGSALYEPGATHPDGTITDATRASVLESVGQFFKPELINRLDEQLVFNKLPPSVILDIVSLRLKELQSRLDTRRIKLQVSQEAKEWLARKGFSEQYGARAVQRVILHEVSNQIANSMLKGDIKWVVPLSFRADGRDGEIVHIESAGDGISITSLPDESLLAEDEASSTSEIDNDGDFVAQRV